MRYLGLLVLAIVLLGAAAWLWFDAQPGPASEPAAATTAEPSREAGQLIAAPPTATPERQQVAAPQARAARPEVAAAATPAQLTVLARFVDEHGGACAAETIQVALVWPPVSSGLPTLTSRHMRNSEFTTGATGDLRATLAAPIGDAILRVECHHRQRAMDRLERRLTLTAGDNRLDLGVVAIRTRHLVEARVVDDAGQPYLGARVTLTPSATGNTAGLAAGPDSNLAQGYALPGSYLVHAGRGGAVLSPQTVEVPHAGPIDVVMRRETTLSGVVRDAAGKPVSGVVVMVEDHDDPAARVQIPNDRSGAFKLGGGSRPAGRKANLWVYSGGRYALTNGTGDPLRVPVTWGSEDIVVQVVAVSCTARVRVVRAADRQPLTAYRLWVDPPADVRTKHPDAFAGWVPGPAQHPDGVLQVPHVVPDVQTLLVVPEDRALALTAHVLRANVGENVVEIAVAAAPETVVRCFGPDGEPVDAQLELLTHEGDLPANHPATDIRVTPPGAWKTPPTKWRHDATKAREGRGVLRGGQLGAAALVHAPEFGVTLPITLTAHAEVTLTTQGRGELTVRFTNREFTSLAPVLMAIPRSTGVSASATIDKEVTTLPLAAGHYDLHLTGDLWNPARTPSLGDVLITATGKTEITLVTEAYRPGLLRWRAAGNVQFLQNHGPALALHRGRNPSGFSETMLLPGDYDAAGPAGVAHVRIEPGATHEVDLQLAPSRFVLVLRQGGAPLPGRRVALARDAALAGRVPPLGITDHEGRVPLMTSSKPRGLRLEVQGVAEKLGPFDWPDDGELVVEVPR